MRDFVITLERTGLQQTTGYWSGRKIFCNLTSNLVVLRKPLSADDLFRETALLQETIATTSFKSYFEKWIGKNYLGSFTLTTVLAEHNASWSGLQKQLREKKHNKNRISRYMSAQWWQHHQANPFEKFDIKRMDRIPSPLSPLVINWLPLVSEPSDEFILRMCKISQLRSQPDRKKYPKYSTLPPSERYRLFIADLPIEERTILEWAAPFLSRSSDPKAYFHGVRCVIHAAATLLAWLRSQELLILPLQLKNINSELPNFEVWPKRLLKSKQAAPLLKTGLLDLISATTIGHIDDIPADLLNIYGPDSFNSIFYKHLSNWLKHPAIERKRAVFPIDRLLIANLLRIKHIPKWSPQWVNKHCNAEWSDFIQLWWLHTTTDSHKRNVVRNFLEWAWDERRFDSPWDIAPIDLRNPHRPSYHGTYFNFLKRKNVLNKSSCWSNSATLFKETCQHAQLPESPTLFHGTIQNPFESLPNPFSNRRIKSNKTHRSSIPSTIHELMIDILLSPDQAGKPTFSWAKQILTGPHRDIVKVVDPDNSNKEIEVWCPSRATCLAILMLTPLRSAQARWLDQGLMDTAYYDFALKAMAPNQHPLTNFKYPNGNSHEKQYGRPSGILQFSSDLLTSEQELSIYVNTNKTQLWSGTRKAGYIMPWPDGTNLLTSTDPEQREKGKWLARVYRVIEYQIKWMNKHAPNPQPVSFFHSSEDKSRTTELDEVKDSLSWFVPLFRDLDIEKAISYKLHGKLLRAQCPVSKSKISRLFNLLAAETEKQYEQKYGKKIYLTVPDTKNGPPRSRFDLHSLRVTWISRLFEMGVPVHIISEFIVGHATQLMTILYLKVQSAYARESIIRGATQGDALLGLDALLDRVNQGDNIQEYLVNSSHNGNISDYLPDDFVAIVLVEGGICPMGGKGSMCHEGAIISQRDRKKIANIMSLEE